MLKVRKIVDIICLVKSEKIDWNYYNKLVENFKLEKYKERLKEIVRSARIEFEYLGIRNPAEIRKIKESILRLLQ